MAPKRLRKVVERHKVSTFDRRADRRLAVCLVRCFCRELTASLHAAQPPPAQSVERAAESRCVYLLWLRFCRELTASLQAAKARLAQSVEHETLNLRVVGSSPT